MYLLTEGATAAANFDFSSIDFSSVLTTFTTVLGVGAGTVIAFVGLKKGWNFLIGMLKRA